ncbi:MAG: hypothetical protein ACOYYS_09620 [Chloroflexota bacterium]
MTIVRKIYPLMAAFFLMGMTALIVPVLGSMIRIVAPAPGTASTCETVVLAARDDPFYPLAEEIAAAESASLAHTLPDALACSPTFLVWVASPQQLSDAVMVDFGLAMKAQASAVSSGIITGSTLADARSLWARRLQVRSRVLFAVNAPNEAAHIAAGRIIAFAPQKKITPLTRGNFEHTLLAADYVTFTGHGSNRALNLDGETKITAGDVPPLDALVIGTGSCQTVRPWNGDSIALRFVDRGAAAYSGFVFSPNSGYLFGGFDGLPFRYTWPGFPIGHVVQVQNRGALQAYAHFPFQHLLGAPQISLQAEAPYHVRDDTIAGELRTLVLGDVPSGVIPIRIPGGAAYSFVEVVGITAAAEQDAFYNSRLQMADIQGDKYLLLVHRGGDLTLRLHRQAPWYWFPLDVLLDSFDQALIFSLQSGGDVIAIAFAALPLLWVGRQLFKRRLSRFKIFLASGVGLAAAVFQAVYGLVRLEHVTVTSKAVVFSLPGVLAAFLLCSCGALIYFQARSWAGKVTALWVMTFVSWSSTVFILVLFAAFNVFAAAPGIGVPLYTYSLGLLPASSFLLSFVFYGLILWLLSRGRAA